MNPTFPELPPWYDAALREAVAWIVTRYEVLGLIAAGTIIRGQPDANSDFDLYVIQPQPRRQRVQRRFQGVPAEIFVNPPHVVRDYFVQERARPVTAHILAHGFVVLARDPVVDALRREAHTWLATLPDLSPVQRTMRRYLAADTLENALDVGERDPATATLILHDAVARMIEYAFLAANRHLPRPKETLAKLGEIDPAAEALARRYYAAAWPDRLAAAQALAEQLIQATGFFEWESPWEEMPDEQADNCAG